MKDHLRLIVNEPIRSDEIQPFKNLKYLNKACLNTSLIEDLSIQPLMSKIVNMGGWPVLGNWNSVDWTWTKTVAKLREHGFSVSSIFSFSITTDQRESTKRTARVSTSYHT
jgi:neprilysin